MDKPSAYQGDEPYIFVCYGHEDADTVYPEIVWLQAEGVNVWYDEGVSPGTEWSEALAEAIEGCAKFLFFVTPYSITREHCRRELNFAQEEGRDVLAVHLQPSEVPGGLRLSLNNRQAIYKHELSDEQYRRQLLQTILGSTAKSPAKPVAQRSMRVPQLAIFGVAALLILAAGGWWLRAPVEMPLAERHEMEPIAKPVTGAWQRAIAVMPFDNLSPEPDHAYFAAGIHDEIITQLGKVRGVAVISRATMVRYSNLDKSLPQIAGELNVDAIISGSVRYAADQVRVTVQLVDPATGTQLWSDVYQERLENIFKIQTAVARQVASSLNVQVAAGDSALSSKPLTTNAAAYAHYLRANSLAWAGLNPYRDVYEELDRAIDADPEFAAAYASKAFYQAVVGPTPDLYASVDDVKTWRRKAQKNARRALEIEPDEARAILTLGILAESSADFDQAAILIERAYELNPNDIYNLAFLAQLRTRQGRWPDVLALSEYIMALDPLDFWHPLGLSHKAWWLEEYATAADAAQQAMALTPSVYPFSGNLAAAQAAAGLDDAPTAVRNLEQALELGRDHPQRAALVAAAASVYHQLNMQAEARELLDELETLAASQFVPSETRLLAYLGSSDVDMIVHWLALAMQEESCGQACVHILHLQQHSALDGVRDHPKFRALVEGI